jgi:hypothetical protein
MQVMFAGRKVLSVTKINQRKRLHNCCFDKIIIAKISLASHKIKYRK